MKNKFDFYLRSLKYKISSFMVGRYGTDELAKFLLIIFAFFVVLSMFIKGKVGSLLNIVGIVVIAFAYYRIFSKDYYKRRSENEKYLKVVQSFKNEESFYKESWVQRNDYKFFKCSACKASMRVPKGKGKVRIVCRKCGNSFIGKT